MSASTFCFTKAGIGAVISLSGIGWATTFDHWQGRVWFLVVILTASFALAGLVLRAEQREVAAMALGLDLHQLVDQKDREVSRGAVTRLRDWQGTPDDHSSRR